MILKRAFSSVCVVMNTHVILLTMIFFKKTGEINPIFTYTDVPKIDSAVLTITNVDHQTIDVFEDKCLCDLFLMTLKYLMLKGEFDDETKSKINDWYFSDSPKYKILD